MKKIVLVSIAVIFSLSFVSAQNPERMRNQHRDFHRQEIRKFAQLDLSEEQNDQIKSLRLEFSSNTLDLRNELRELNAHYRTLMSGSNQDLGKIDSNIEKRQDLRASIAKEKARLQLEIRKVLTEEQRIIMDSHRKGRPGHGPHRGINRLG